MTRKNILDETVIEFPCTANWDAMTGSDQIRFCSECNKYVYNLSAMTRGKAESILLSRNDQVCARLIRDLEGQTLTIDSVRPVRLMSWKPGPVSGAVVSALMSIAPCATPAVNGEVPSPVTYRVDESGRKIERSIPTGATSALTGIVSNEKGAALPGAIVTLTEEASGELVSQLTSGEGEFRFEGLEPRTYIIEILAKDYEGFKRHDLKLQAGEGRRLDVQLDKLILVMGAMGRPAQPLRTLYLESDRVVVAEVENRTRTSRKGEFKTTLNVAQTIKGDGHKPGIEVYHQDYDEVRLPKGEPLLLFLQRREDAAGKDAYGLIYGETSARQLSPSALQTYLQRIDELKVLLDSPNSTPSDVAEWLVQCAENPITRREGSFELNWSAVRERFEQEEKAASETDAPPVPTPRTRRAQDAPLFSALLTNEQKERLVVALLKSTDLATDGDVELIRLVQHWNDSRLLPFLMSYLHRFHEQAPSSLGNVLRTVADILRDEKLSILANHYYLNDPFAGLDAELNEVRSASETEQASLEADDDENEDSDDDEDGEKEEESDGVENEDDGETVDVGAESESAAKLTAEASRQAKVQLVKRFLEMAEAKMKIALQK